MKLEIHPAATQEFQESIGWYENETQGLGQKFADAVLARLEKLLKNPMQGKKQWHNYREVIADRKFPFLIVFKVLEKDNALFVSAIFHTSRHPRGKYRSPL